MPRSRMRGLRIVPAAADSLNFDVASEQIAAAKVTMAMMNDGVRPGNAAILSKGPD